MTEKLAARSPSLKARMAGAGARKTVYPSVPSTPEQIKDLPTNSTRSPRHMLPHDVAKWQWENKLEPRYKGDKLSSANPFLAGPDARETVGGSVDQIVKQALASKTVWAAINKRRYPGKPELGAQAIRSKPGSLEPKSPEHKELRSTIKTVQELHPKQAFMQGFLGELSKESFEQESVLLGVAIPSIIRRLTAMGAVAKAKKITQALEAKGLPTEGLPFTVQNPGLGALFAPGRLKQRVAEVETAAKEYADRRMGRAMSKEIAGALS